MSEKIEELKKRREQLSARIVNAEQREKDKQRKQRTRQLIEIGGLVDIAGLRQFDKGALLGGLMYLAAIADDPKNEKIVKRWKVNGDNVLEKRKRDRKKPKRKKS